MLSTSQSQSPSRASQITTGRDRRRPRYAKSRTGAAHRQIGPAWITRRVGLVALTWLLATAALPGTSLAISNGQGPVEITGMSCPSVSFCAVVTSGGMFVWSTHPAAASSAWHRFLLDTTPAPPTAPPRPGPNDPLLETVSCPTSSLCVAVDGEGNLLSSTDPTAGPAAWSIGHLADALDDVSCPSPSLCVAGGRLGGSGAIFVSTNPAGGPGTFTNSTPAIPPQSDTGFPEVVAVACPTSAACVTLPEGASSDPAGGPASWSPTNGLDPSDILNMNNLACASTSLCVAVGRQDIATSTRPVDGSPWSNAPVDSLFGGAGLGGGLACPTTTLCLTSAPDTNIIVVSIDPRGGTSAWKQQITLPFPPNPDGATPSVTAISCQATGLCLIGGNDGTLWLSHNPTGSAHTWTAFLPAGGSGIAVATLGKPVRHRSTITLGVRCDGGLAGSACAVSVNSIARSGVKFLEALTPTTRRLRLAVGQHTTMRFRLTRAANALLSRGRTIRVTFEGSAGEAILLLRPHTDAGDKPR